MTSRLIAENARAWCRVFMALGFALVLLPMSLALALWAIFYDSNDPSVGR